MTTVLFESPRCHVCKETTRVELDAEKYRRWQSGEHIQNVWPEMPKEEREVMISGTHGECWDKLWCVCEEAGKDECPVHGDES